MYYDKFEELCEKHGIRPGQVSKETGISTSTLSSWKKGRYTPKNDKLQVIADYFNVPINYFLSDAKALYSDTAKYLEYANANRPSDVTFNFEDLKLMANIACDAKRSVIFAWLSTAPDEDISLVLSLIRRLSVKEGE